MKILFSAIMVLLTCSNLVAQVDNPTISLSKLSRNVYVHTTYKDFNGRPFPSNGLFIVLDTSIVLIDTSWGDDDKMQRLADTLYQRHHKRISHCIVTHYHDDRTGGLDYLKAIGVKTYSSKKTYDLCAEKVNLVTLKRKTT